MARPDNPPAWDDQVGVALMLIGGVAPFVVAGVAGVWLARTLIRAAR